MFLGFSLHKSLKDIIFYSYIFLFLGISLLIVHIYRYHLYKHVKYDLNDDKKNW